jgi:hypothetical protein
LQRHADAWQKEGASKTVASWVRHGAELRTWRRGERQRTARNATSRIFVDGKAVAQDSAAMQWVRMHGLPALVQERVVTPVTGSGAGSALQCRCRRKVGDEGRQEARGGGPFQDDGSSGVAVLVAGAPQVHRSAVARGRGSAAAGRLADGGGRSTRCHWRRRAARRRGSSSTA